MGVSGERVEWMSEYAEFHSINENAYVNASNVAGMGSVIAAQPSGLPGSTIGTNWSSNGGTLGSGDVGQNLLPVAMKIAAQTIGLDLVAVKPTPGPKIDLLYIDFQYDDTRLGAQDERPQVFKVVANAGVTTALTALLASNSITQTQGGLAGGRLFTSINTSNTYTAEQASKAGLLEFLGFSRIDGYPMFRAYRQANTAHTAVGSAGTLWGFDTTRNTFNPTASMISQISFLGGTAATVTDIQLVSALEDHIPGFSANWYGATSSAAVGSYPMERSYDDESITVGVADTILLNSDGSYNEKYDSSYMLTTNKWSPQHDDIREGATLS